MKRQEKITALTEKMGVFFANIPPALIKNIAKYYLHENSLNTNIHFSLHKMK